MTDAGRAQFLGRPVPRGFGVRRISIPPGRERRSGRGEWHGAMVVLEQGAVEVVDTAGARRRFRPGDMLCLEWAGCERIVNVGADAARLLAIHHPVRSTVAKPPISHVIEEDSPMQFHTTLLSSGGTTTGFEVPAHVVEALGSGKRPPVKVTINGYTYRNTVAVMGGVYMLGVSAEHRAASGLEAGDEIDVELELDTAPREVEVPVDLAAALEADPDAKRTWDGLSYSNRRFHAELIEGAKTDETRERRIAKAVAVLHEGRAR